jgi:oligopeptidase B
LKDDLFFLVTNENAPNYKVLRGQLTTPTKNWDVFIPHREDTLLEEIEIFSGFMAVTERNNGLTKLRLIDYENHFDKYIRFPEETYTVYIGINAEMQSKRVRYVYNSLTTPASVMEYDLETGKTEVLKEDEVAGGGFDKNNYRSVRLWAPGRDGTRIPVSLVWHKKTELYGNNPLLLYGYGAYGITVDDNFSKNRLSLLDRGFVFAIAHVRGGEYLGRKWYEDGKLLKKKNTFYDFIDTARFLVAQKITSPGKLYAMGGSAGGLLVGAVANIAPGLFHGIVAQVPFVDVLTTMLDPGIPLTTGEYDEWGNPNEKKFYDYIKSYSPYDNIVAQAYPNILATAGFHDSQVQYWEPAKWVAKLRDHNTSDSVILLHTDMNTGHSGATGRFQSLRDTARDFAFILDLAGKTETDENQR